MQRKIPSKPRFRYVKQKAYEFLIELGLNTFPISAFDVLNELSDFIKYSSWSYARTLLQCDDPFHLMEQGADARTLLPPGSQTYCIVYDDSERQSPERINWTLMHEIGHIILGHLRDFGETALDRGGLSSEQYGVLEVETNFFAAEVLMPTPVFRHFSGLSANFLALLCGVTDKPATTQIKALERARNFQPMKIEEKVYRNFFSFINRFSETIFNNTYNKYGLSKKAKYVGTSRKCPSCHTYTLNQDHEYCYYCGALLAIEDTGSIMENMRAQYNLVKAEGQTHPNFPYTRITYKNKREVYKPIVCPMCLNTEFSEDASYCRVCGNPLFFECQKCGSDLQLKQRFCPKCGGISSYKDTYFLAEYRINSLRIRAERVATAKEWLTYEHWSYVTYSLMRDKEYYDEMLISALLYSTAFLDDDEKIILMVDTIGAKKYLVSHHQEILQYIQNKGGIEFSGMEIIEI